LYYRPTAIPYGEERRGGGSKDDQDNSEAARRSCPNCGQTIQKDLKTCPYCNKALSLFNDPKIKSDIDEMTKEMEDAIDNAFKTNCLGECQRNAMLRTLSGSSALGYGQRRVLTSLLGNIMDQKDEKDRRTQVQLLRRYLGMVQLPKDIIEELEGAFQLDHLQKSTELKK
jgi:glutaredoxin